MTIGTRLALWYSGLLAVLVIFFGTVVILISRLFVFYTVDDVLQNTATEIHEMLVQSPTQEDRSRFDEDALHRTDIFHTPGISVQLWGFDQSGDLFLITSSDDLLAVDHPLHAGMLDSEEAHFENIIYNETPERILTEPIYDDTGQKIAVIQVSTVLSLLNQSNRQLYFVVVGLVVVAALISLGLGVWLSRHLLKPVKAMTQTAATIANAEDLSVRLNWDGPMDELGELTTVFNQTLERLEHLFTVQRQFLADVSHELRTPLTAIRGHVEVMGRYGIEDESLEAIHEATERMGRMVNDLLLLTRIDSGEIDLMLQRVNLDALVLEIYEKAFVYAKVRGVLLSLGQIEPAPMIGDPIFLRQMIEHLLNNAIQYTLERGRVTLSVYQEGHEVFLDIRDTGIGISAENHSRIFDRFYQVDTSRTQQDVLCGAGLGLSIVQWIVTTHKGRIEVTSEDSGGSHFRVSMPADPTAGKKKVTTYPAYSPSTS